MSTEQAAMYRTDDNRDVTASASSKVHCLTDGTTTTVLRYYQSCGVLDVRRIGTPLEPHPAQEPSLPTIGNVHQVPTEYIAHWAEGSYSRHREMLNEMTEPGHDSAQRVACDLLEKRGSIYNSRRRSVVQRDRRRRKQRRWIQAMFNDQAALRSYDRIWQRELYKLLLALMQTPENFVMHIERDPGDPSKFVAALLLEIPYGRKVDSLDDPYFLLMDMATRGTADGGGAAALVDSSPSRSKSWFTHCDTVRFMPSWMPGAGFMWHALKMKEIVRLASHGPYEATKAAVRTGTATPSLIANRVEGAQRKGTFAEDERDIRTAAATSSSVGLDTNKGSLILAMVIYPNVFRKAQEEVDVVIGAHRLSPSWKTEASCHTLVVSSQKYCGK
ncbi:hypothetical protein DAEQUDRAFT_736468 [Daedalea quercina L-15889]|uniref:Uncharacterized protein n=1 Tax=Daedalea quercina L-15889 TaxID=1314783 RepID=A0A165SHB4_9APHY|nr:hypothetical protein DAEQUDRAFT_736468 [Daedalea quercina L-15889]